MEMSHGAKSGQFGGCSSVVMCLSQKVQTASHKNVMLCEQAGAFPDEEWEHFNSSSYFLWLFQLYLNFLIIILVYFCSFWNLFFQNYANDIKKTLWAWLWIWILRQAFFIPSVDDVYCSSTVIHLKIVLEDRDLISLLK